MSIIANKRKKGTTYTAVVRKGKYRNKPLKQTFSTKGQARYWKAEQERLIDMKIHRDPRLADEVSLSEALEKYEKHGRHIKKKAESTLDREIHSGNQLKRYFGQDAPLSDISSAATNKYQINRLSEGASTSSIRQELALLSGMYRTAKKIWELPVENPVEGVDRIPAEPGRDRFLTDNEAKIIISESRKSLNRKFYPFVLLLMHTGMRTGEAAKLKVAGIKLDRRILTIKETKTGNPRTIGVSNEVIDAIKPLQPEKDGFYFLKPNHRKSYHTMLRPGSIFRECWKQLWKRIERDYTNNETYRAENKDYIPIPPFRPHDIRHTAGSHLLRAGVDIRIIADILGHSTLQMVLRYTHLFDESKVKYADMLSYLGKGDQDEQEREAEND